MIKFALRQKSTGKLASYIRADDPASGTALFELRMDYPISGEDEYPIWCVEYAVRAELARVGNGRGFRYTAPRNMHDPEDLEIVQLNIEISGYQPAYTDDDA